MSETTVYVSYALDDAAHAERLCNELVEAGYTIAVNTHTVAGGLPLAPALKSSMASAAAFIACFSARDGAPTTYEVDELSLALDAVTAGPPREPWLIPVKLTPCEIPRLRLGTSSVDQCAAIDLHIEWDLGIKRLLSSLPAVDNARNTSKVCPDVQSTVKFVVKDQRGDEFHIIGAEGSDAPSVKVDGSVGTNTTKITRIVGSIGKRGPA